jgi:hypothetical protein
MLAEEDKLGDTRSRLRVEVDSTEILIVWIGFCLVHREAVRKHPIVDNYSVALDWQSLQHLVLLNKASIDAAVTVGTFLRERSSKPVIFCLADPSGTLDLALKFSQNDLTILELWGKEDAAAKSKKASNRELVKSMQEKVMQLERECAELKRESQFLEFKVYDSQWCSSEQSTDRARRADLHGLILTAERSVRNARKPPDLLRLPLPADKDKATTILFFAYMPERLHVLSRLSMMAQQVLLPSKKKRSASFSIITQSDLISMENTIKCTREGRKWQEYHHKNGPNFNWGFPNRLDKVEIYAVGDVPTQSSQVSPFENDVMMYTQENHGVWHPDALKTVMMWSGGNFDLDRIDSPWGSSSDICFDPWKTLKKGTIVDGLTEADASLLRSKCQWVLPQYGSDTAASRGNQAVALQHLKPRWLSKPEWLSIAVLRAFPHQQLQRLLSGLRDELLPLAQPAMRTIANQLIGHLGELSDEDSLQLLWKVDQMKGAWCAQVTSELKRYCAILQDKPREFRSVLVLAETAEYVSQWYPKCRDVSRQFSSMLDRFASEVLSQIQDTDPKFTHELRSKSCLLQMHAIVCHLRGKLNEADVNDIVRLRVQATNGMLFHDKTQFDGELKSAAQLCELVLTRRSGEMIALCAQNDFAPLTIAVRTIISGAPVKLNWQPMHLAEAVSRTACFEAVDEAQSPRCHYSVNLVSGIVLFNGLPPSRLPHSIVAHPLYQLHFGDRTFEVCTVTAATAHSSGTLQTTGNVEGRSYTFELQHSGQLVIFEAWTDTRGEEMTLRLLDRKQESALHAAWTEELPSRLQEMHSFWHDLKANVIFLRGVLFADRVISFFVTCANRSNPVHEANDWQVFRVPEYLQNDDWAVVSKASNLDRLVRHSSRAIEVLHKFEAPAFIETYLDGAGDCDRSAPALLKIELPRFSLAFRFDASDENLHSLDYVGYHLARRQQLADSMCGFQQYLVLERTASGKGLDIKLLVPQGSLSVIRDTNGPSVTVELPTGCSETILHHAYSVHPRFLDLRATSIASRLQLAAVYAITGSMRVDERIGMLGGEFAMDLIRKCATDRPLSQDEHGHLYMVARSCHRTPALVLLCHDLALNSAQLAFMHPESATSSRCSERSIVTVYQDAVTEYLSANRVVRFRGRLSDAEERRLLGGAAQWRPRTCVINNRAPVSASSVEIARGPVPFDFVEVKEHDLCKLITTDGVKLKMQIARGAPDRTVVPSETIVGATRGATRLPNPPAASPETQARAPKRRLSQRARRMKQEKEAEAKPRLDSGGGRQPKEGSFIGYDSKSTGAVAYRIDKSDGVAYPLGSFVEVYGGNSKHPPLQWRVARCAGNGWHCSSCTSLNSPFSAACDTCGGHNQDHLGEINNGGPQVTGDDFPENDLPPFPFHRSEGRTAVAKELKNDLESSWKAHHAQPKKQLDQRFKDEIVGSSRAVSDARRQTESHVLSSLLVVPNSASLLAPIFRMQQLVNVAPTPILQDLVRASWDESIVSQINPFLSTDGRKTICELILLWEKLCVLEDKMERLEQLLDKPTSNRLDLLQTELETQRVWSASEHPRWLAFELEFGLQIRPKQFFVANRMIASSSAGLQPVVQLNMGEGKTRVILPMLALFFGTRGKLPRLTVLSAISKEAHEYLHDVLTASLQGCNVCALPVVRDIDLNLGRLDAIWRCLERCRKSCGALIVAPEHRQSFHLKSIELKLRLESVGEAGSQSDDMACSNLLKKLQNSFPFVDVLDESDEVLRPSTKLVYTHGQHVQLPALALRCDMIMAVLRVINMDDSIATLNPRSLILEDRNHWPGGFRAVRIIPGLPFEENRSAFLVKIATLVLCDPEPLHTLRWANELARRNERLMRAIIKFTTTARDNIAALEQQLQDGLDESQLASVYMLRGLLIHDLLAHCLQKRYRVDYGINPAGQKRIAIPYHGSDTPAPRAEFAHPDCGVIFTLLSYYNSGLNEEQVKQSFETLLDLGGDAQQAIYSRWFAASAPQMLCDDAHSVATIAKVDLSNSQQLGLLCKFFAGNTFTVNFFLTHHVFCEELHQFPFRIEATAWDLAQSSQQMVMGFSGTKDNKLLFPTQLTFVAPENEGLGQELLGTDGKMVHLIQGHSRYHHLFSGIATSGGDAGNWKPTLSYLVEVIKEEQARGFATKPGRTTALIDAGAMMAGKTNLEVADYLLDGTTAACFRGVVYFSHSHGEWRVRNHQGAEWSKSSSPIHERDAFVYFDESRCRGADMKLLQTAKAVLCLGPKMQKDKFMQAAARLRKLGCSQKITLVAPRDVDAQIRVFNKLDDSADIAPHHVVSWTLQNAEIAVARWIPEWSNQGLQFCAIADKPSLALVPEILDLKSLYSSSINEPNAYVAWSAKKKRDERARDASPTATASAQVLSTVEQRMNLYGREIQVESATLDQECERELEKEIELEVEQVAEVSPQEARREDAWDYSSLYNHRCYVAKDLPVRVQLLQTFVEARIKFEVDASSLAFSQHLYGTQNFFESCNSAGPLNEYLRPVGFVIQLPSDDFILVSEREADAIRGEMHRRYDISTPPMFKLLGMQDLDACLSKCKPRIVEVAASLRLFRGKTICPTQLRPALRAILTGSESAPGIHTSKSVARTFVKLRGRDAFWDRSDLEEVSTTYRFD